MNILLSILLATTDSTVVKSITEHLLNDIDGSLFAACIIAGYMGYFLYFLWTIEFRDKYSTHSPVEWDWQYFWNKNSLSMLRDLFTIPFVILFYPQILDLALTGLEKIDVLPDWAGKMFDTYNTTTVFTSLVVGVLFKEAMRRARKWKWKKKQGQTKKTGLDG